MKERPQDCGCVPAGTETQQAWVEFLQKQREVSVLRELFLKRSSRTVLHHLACIVDDIKSTAASLEKVAVGFDGRDPVREWDFAPPT